MIGKTRGLWELKRLNLKGEGMVRDPGGKLGLILSGRRKEEQGGKQSVQRLYKDKRNRVQRCRLEWRGVGCGQKRGTDERDEAL